MRNRRGKFDMPHTFTTDFRAGNFYAALVANYAFVSYTFIFTAVAFPVLGRSENSFAEQAVAFGLLRAVVDGFRLGNLAVRPFADLFGSRDSDLHRIEIV